MEGLWKDCGECVDCLAMSPELPAIAWLSSPTADRCPPCDFMTRGSGAVLAYDHIRLVAAPKGFETPRFVIQRGQRSPIAVSKCVTRESKLRLQPCAAIQDLRIPIPITWYICNKASLLLVKPIYSLERHNTMGLGKILRRAGEEKEKEALRDAPEHYERSSPPPSYTGAHQLPPQYDSEDIQGPPDITAGFSNLTLSGHNSSPSRDQCIAHLKLLECFYRLRRTIGSTDGAFGICNASPRKIDDAVDLQDPELLTVLAEKRWAIYVGRAVDRFQRWRDNIAPSRNAVTVDECESGGALEGHMRQIVHLKTIRFDDHNIPPVGAYGIVAASYI